MRRDSFFRCYLEAMALWIGGNVLMAIALSASVAMDWISDPLTRTLADRLSQVFDPFFLIASGIMVVPLFTAILVANKRDTHADHDK